MSCFSPYNPSINELDLSNYATVSYLKNAAGVNTSKFGKKII